MLQQDDHEPRTNRPFTAPDRPERGHWRKLPRLMLLLTSGGSILLVGAILLVVWQVVAPQPASGGDGTGSPGTGAAATKRTQPEQGYPALYWQTIREQVAAGLHLTVDQLKARLTTPTEQGPKGPTTPDISEVAMQQGIDAEHVRMIEIAALHQAGAALVQQHLWTQQQADQQMQTVNNEPATKLNALVTSAFVSH